ncbi:MAG: endonuclease/exonuclease/phosphatase family protein [Actinomycetota bacterium]
MIIHALSWNLFHGRDAPPDPSLYTWRSRLLKITERGDRYVQVNRNLFTEFSTELSRMEWDVALLQECPPHWAGPLAEALGAETHRVLTSRNWLPRLSAVIATLNPDLIASGEGGSNLTLLRGSLLRPNETAVAERRELVIRERHPERRTMAFTRTRAGLCVANLHSTNDRPELASEEVLKAATSAVEWAAGAPLLFGGDLNLRPAEHPEVFEELGGRFGLARPTAPDSIDHLLVRGVEVTEEPHHLPPPEVVREPATAGPLGLWGREAGRRIRLSDHTPVAAALELGGAP